MSALQTGLYRVDVTGDGDSSTFTVRGGNAEVGTEGMTVALGAGQSATLSGLNAPQPAGYTQLLLPTNSTNGA